jgi:alanine racemase
MVRIGILLYGYKPFESDLLSVEPCMKIYAPVLKSFTLKKGESALYGKLTAKEDLNLSLIRYGYADGLMRKGTPREFNNRCMDITAVKDKSRVGRLIPVMTDADKFAKEYGTISYEVLTKCAFRAEKIYLN